MAAVTRKDENLEIPLSRSILEFFNSRSYGTATYNGTLVAVQMILEKMKDNPNARPIIFVLSDGETNQGYEFERAAQIIEALGITVNTIGYNANLDELSKLSAINESVSINADSEDVIYKLKELFNAEF